MRKIRYMVATSLDGFIVGPNGEIDWIEMDPEVDFASIWAEFDTLLMGRKTYDVAIQRLGKQSFSGITSIVFSRTMKPAEHPGVTIVSNLQPAWVQALKEKSGRDIWLMGGSELFRTFLDAGYVDTVEVNIIPVMLGAGLSLLLPPYHPTKLRLTSSKVYRSGRVSLAYEVSGTRTV
ncbi:MAG TPA: dihydrofolate reductase family protein [Candidatus Sulfotelmatobacter sp.]|nr:dihydrofolate reductase family protein [Candidatus Sulfotelmatobacter sp.]